MDLSILYFFFPRLGESRIRVAKHAMLFPEWKWSGRRRRLPIKGRKQYVRLAVADGSPGEWKKIGSWQTSDGRIVPAPVVIGTTDDGREVRFRPVEQYARFVNYWPDEDITSISSLLVRSRQPIAADITWVCQRADNSAAK
ncbi:hypothetical protein ACTOWA_00435 [Herbaspirillum seropedicae]|uniref:hypothetical protein n=1 Tax=Herbaspirillum seropedicae TaxID=964 RepID=UPI002858AFA4|nr:hypothetical protein [Herbaspirillum seropedicae]MDR6397940.1 hypothetical protein [Herbaspirillum seropedicae]